VGSPQGSGAVKFNRHKLGKRHLFGTPLSFTIRMGDYQKKRGEVK
jgi:hypothetical protein